jgi:cell division protein FtsB
VLAALVAAILLASVVPLQQFLEQRGRIARLEHEAAQLEQANRDVAARIDRLKDPTVLERLARECLGMVRPDEIRFVPVPEGGAPATPDC